MTEFCLCAAKKFVDQDEIRVTFKRKTDGLALTRPQVCVKA